MCLNNSRHSKIFVEGMIEGRKERREGEKEEGGREEGRGEEGEGRNTEWEGARMEQSHKKPNVWLGISVTECKEFVHQASRAKQ